MRHGPERVKPLRITDFIPKTKKLNVMKRIYQLLCSVLLSTFAASASATSPQDVDFSRILTWYGEGENQLALVFSWNDDKGADNFVVGIKYDDTPACGNTLDDIFAYMVQNDRRFYFPDGSGTPDLCFDQGGEGKLADPEYTIFDHLGLSSEGGSWNMETVSNDGGEIISFSFEAEGDEQSTELPYIFYLPGAEAQGAWVPDGVSVPLADASQLVPVYVNSLVGNRSANLSFTLSTPEEKKIGLSFSLPGGTAALEKGDSRALLKFATFAASDNVDQHAGVITPKLTYRYFKGAATTATSMSAIATGSITVTPPLTPQSLSFLEGDHDAEVTLKDIIHIVSEPEDALYTGGFSFTYENLENPGGTAQGYASSNTADARLVTASFNKLYTGRMKLTATAKAYPGLSATCIINVYAERPITEISIGDLAGAEIHLNAYVDEEFMYNVHPVKVTFSPEDASLPTVKLHTSMDDAEGGVPVTASYQKADGCYDLATKAFGTRISPQLIYSATNEQKWENLNKNLALLAEYENQDPITLTAWFEPTDGGDVKSEEFTIVIDPRDRTPLPDNYQDGMFWLNEEWYGHTNGSINYITEDKEVKYRVYEAQNPGHSFGCTSQYGMIYGDRLYVVSKQAYDRNDLYRVGGGRLVIADAKTLKRITSFEELGTTSDGKDGATGSTLMGDGRACVGVRPDKVYLGHHKGIRILNIDTQKAASEDPEVAASAFTMGGEILLHEGVKQGLYEGQTGDMVCAGKYVFVVTQSDGLLAIDGDTDAIVKKLGTNIGTVEKETYSVQGVVITADGHVWYAETDNTDTSNRRTTFVEVDPLTLEELARYDLPAGAGTVNTGWGAWRSANFFASKKQNVIYWGNVGSGYKDDILGAGTGNIYRWEVGTDLPSRPFFSLGNRPGMNETTFQMPYATMRYDDRTDEIWMCTTHGPSYNYRYEWIYAIDGTTGEENFCQQLTPYFWFPAIPIFPDKYDPEFRNLTGVTLGTDPMEIDLYDYVYDEDHITRAINLSVESPSASAATRSAEAFDHSLVNGKLTLTPKSVGEGELTLVAESNGKTVRHTLPVSVSMKTGVNEVGTTRALSASGRILTAEGLEGCVLNVYDMNGRQVAQFIPASDHETFLLDMEAGVYIVKGDTSMIKVMIK